MPDPNSSEYDNNNVLEKLEALAPGLTPAELRELARKVYELFKRDLSIERDRFGRSKQK